MKKIGWITGKKKLLRLAGLSLMGGAALEWLRKYGKECGGGSVVYICQ